MNIKCGIVGMPNVGKSTLFNALLKKQVALAANYPFATIEPNVGAIEVPDARLSKLAEIVKTSKIVPAIVEFYDIAGLVAGASKGEGLGNQFLSHIREVSVITHVVRLFEDSDIIHVANKVNPQDDIKIIEEELALADLSTLEKQKEPKPASAQGAGESRKEVTRWQTVQKVRNKLNVGVAVRDQALNDEEQELIKDLNLLTVKPIIYCFNCSLEQLDRTSSLDKLGTTLEARIQTILNNQDTNFILFNPLVEETLDILIKKAYETLDLISFLTAGEKEVRAWTIQKGTLAPQAAGVIHTDFEKSFIKAEITNYGDFIAFGGWTGCRERGKARMEGRDYAMQDGDVVDFKVGL